MKELSIEQKAQRYDEVLERAKKVLLDCTSEEQKVVEYITPELKESDDEKIRQELIAMVKLSCTNGDDADKKIAWLEKQGNKDEEILVLKDQIESLHAAIKVLKETHKIELEKQSTQKSLNNQFTSEQANVLDKHIDKFLEQKSAWSEEDENILKEIITDVKFEGYNNDMQANSYKKINWLKSLKNRI